MPPPKDPQKLQEYREKMSHIAKEKGYGKWMLGKTASEETKLKQSKSQSALITPEERGKRSKRAKEKGYGKWMLGKTASEETKLKLSLCRKGKTYEEIYGDDRAKEERLIRKITNIETSAIKKEEGYRPSKKFLTSGKIRRGKKYEEIYGKERGDEEALKRSLAHQKRWEGTTRTGCRDKINGSTEYRVWRRNVFERDNFTCQDCKIRGGRLHAHHIKHWAKYVDLRYSVENGITLCPTCHGKKHKNNKGLLKA